MTVREMAWAMQATEYTIRDTFKSTVILCTNCSGGPSPQRSHLGHYNDVIMSAMACQITSLTIVYSTVYSRRRSKKTSKLRITGLCALNSMVTGEFLPQRASKEENVSIWWRHHGIVGLGSQQHGYIHCCCLYCNIALKRYSLAWSSECKALFYHISTDLLYCSAITISVSYRKRVRWHILLSGYARLDDTSLFVLQINSLAPGKFEWNFR